tara:strand:- start:1836 stop:1997 length:162 start_codon:yes stop_codon:yes gene_type:complete
LPFFFFPFDFVGELDISLTGDGDGEAAVFFSDLSFFYDLPLDFLEVFLSSKFG